MPLKKPARPKGARNAETVRSRKPTEFTGMIAAGAIAVVVLGGVAAAMLTSHEPAQPGYTAGAQAHEAAVADAPARVKPVEPKPERAGAPAAAPHVVATKGDDEPQPAKSSEAIVTIAGCLEHYGSGFRLTDATGDVVPASRSWKSGFLKKRPANIDVVDATSPVRLSNHVDERVSVSGPLLDRRMEVRTLRRISATCADN